MFSIVQAADGSLWFGTPGVVSRLEPEGRWTTYPTAHEFSP